MDSQAELESARALLEGSSAEWLSRMLEEPVKNARTNVEYMAFRDRIS